MKYYNYPNTTEVAEDIDTKNISQYGGGGAGLVVEIVPSDNGMALNSTWQEIANVISNAETVVCKQEIEGTIGAFPVIGVVGGSSFGKYIVITYGGTGTTVTYETTSPDGYPESDG